MCGAWTAPSIESASASNSTKASRSTTFRRFIFFANQGDIRRAQQDDQAVQALCLNLVTNAVIAWNTVYVTRALDVLRADGLSVSDEDLAHLALTLGAHINPYGKYNFDVDAGLARTGFRPLREPAITATA